MNTAFKKRRLALAATLVLATGAAHAAEPLSSWNDGLAKKAIVDFVERVSQEGGADYVHPSERIAVFDNDGTLWSEQPMYVQLAFILDRIKAMAPGHPEWKDTQPYKAVLENDVAALAASGEKGLMELLVATHAGMSTAEFESTANQWIRTARHPKTGELYTGMVFQPMLELLQYLRENRFKTFIVSGGGVEFMRPWSYEVYGIPPEQVVGSQIKVKYEVRDGVPTLAREPGINLVDDKAGKPVGIHYHIGRRPIAAFGNSDGDYQMLEWTTSGPGPRFGMIVHHDDAGREAAYDRESHFGKLDKGLDDAAGKGWIVVSVKDDWSCVFRYACAP
ncbi:HAD family hydrolase [Marilutibacter aestuarii]|uniref:Haloacid dehalogenase-like hydrolase n=1 Tax=Marilutibacter aestuarii TaxID=1706195 RepID=A0A508APA7_9GAMM|nr:HAD family hydrolase [Lysobacter aestuarii]TQD51297.1 haloacid dehalogenase-like hydrolase [Lysobacter aestuarii]